MKRTIIGAALALCGAIIDTGIVLAAAVYAANVTSWQGSLFWYALFGDRYQADAGLRLGIPFVVGAVLLLLGLILLIVELVGTVTPAPAAQTETPEDQG